MQDIPKIVRERLKVAIPVDHPDANVLTAFSEHSLPARERNTVLAHLSRCVDCRDIVALALPPSDAMQPVIVPSRAGWLTWPALRWGFVAVGVVAIASVGLIQYQRRGSETATRMQTLAPAVVTQQAAQQAKTEAPAPIPASVPAPEERKTTPSVQGKAVPLPSGATHRAPVMLDTEARDSLAHSTVHLPQRGATAGGINLGGPVQSNGVFNNGQFANQQQNSQFHGAVSAPRQQLAYSAGAPTSAPAPTSSGARTVHVEHPADDMQAQTTDLALAQNQSVAPIPQDEAKVVTRSKEPEITTVEVASAAPALETSDKDTSRQEMPKAIGEPANGRNVSALVALKPASQLRWTISPSGSLQRSYDQGSSWQDVNVMASLAPASSFASYDANAVTALAKSQPAKKEKHARKQDVVSPVFRTVTATGSNVWAGGSNAALYHSTDAGDHWIRVAPASGSVVLTGDVVALEFLDSQHGKVTTSTPEVWTTADAGQSWQKQ